MNDFTRLEMLINFYMFIESNINTSVGVYYRLHDSTHGFLRTLLSSITYQFSYWSTQPASCKPNKPITFYMVFFCISFDTSVVHLWSFFLVLIYVFVLSYSSVWAKFIAIPIATHSSFFCCLCTLFKSFVFFLF